MAAHDFVVAKRCFEYVPSDFYGASQHLAIGCKFVVTKVLVMMHDLVDRRNCAGCGRKRRELMVTGDTLVSQRHQSPSVRWLIGGVYLATVSFGRPAHSPADLSHRASQFRWVIVWCSQLSGVCCLLALKVLGLALGLSFRALPRGSRRLIFWEWLGCKLCMGFWLPGL